MKVTVQWAAANSPSDWFDIDSDNMGATAFRDVPTEVMSDDAPGWIQALCVQGVILENFDHYGAARWRVGPRLGLAVYVWNDDPTDWPEPHGQRWRFQDPEPDPNVGGQVNTRQWLDVYGPASYTNHWASASTTMGPVGTHLWSAWPSNEIQVVRHGVWVPDAAYDTAQQIRSRRRWEDWKV